MELYDRIKNIRGNNNEEVLKTSILNVREKLKGLVEERMCKIYSGFLIEELNKNHVPSRLVNTLDLNLEYEHEFVLVPSNEKGYFLADLTFSQFNNEENELINLSTFGYQYMDDSCLKMYLSIISNGYNLCDICIDDMFYGTQSFSSKK